MKELSLFQTSSYTTKEKGLIGLLCACYLAGLIGLQLQATAPLFQALTPFNLLLSTAILLYFHRQWNLPFLLFATLCLLVGFFVEVIGVSTGLVFGNYAYGSTLGYQLWGVPLIIGLNWLMLIYSTGIICAKLSASTLLKALLASCLMVLLDLFIEPVAMAFDFWQWENNSVPLHNYAGWFIISFCLHLLFFWLPFEKSNVAAKYLYLLQLLFFIILCLFTIDWR